MFHAGEKKNSKRIPQNTTQTFIEFFWIPDEKEKKNKEPYKKMIKKIYYTHIKDPKLPLSLSKNSEESAESWTMRKNRNESKWIVRSWMYLQTFPRV